MELTLALAIGLALAAGVALGDFVARPRTATHAPDRPNKRMGVESIKIVPADSAK